MRLSLLASTGLLAVVTPTILNADWDFRTEVEVGYSRTEAELGAELDAYQFGARHHFKPVAVSDGPWAEAAFMGRSGFIEGFWIESDIEIDDVDVGADVSTYGAELLWREPEVPYAFHIIYTGEEQQISTGESADFDEYGLGVGYFFAENLYLEFTYAHEDIEASGSYTGESDQYQVSGKYVGTLSKNRFVNLEVSISEFRFEDKTPQQWKGENSVFSISGDYYLNERLSLGLGYLEESGDAIALEGHEYTVRTRYFFIPQLSAMVEYYKFTPENGFIRSDEEGISLVLTGRF